MMQLSKHYFFFGIVLWGMMLGATPAVAQEQEQDMSQFELPRRLYEDSLFYDAMKARMQGDTKRTREALEGVTRIQPKNATAWYELSRLYLDDKKYDKAQEAIRKALSLDNTNNKWFRFQQGITLALLPGGNEKEATRRTEEAADIFMQLAREQSQNELYLSVAGNFYSAAKKYKQALDAFDMLKQKDKDDEGPYRERINVFLKMNDLLSAVKEAEALIATNPYQGSYYVILAQLYSSNNLPDKAAEVYSLAEKMVPDDPDIQLALALRSSKNNDSVGYSQNVRKLILNKSLDVEAQLNFLTTYIAEKFEDTNRRREAQQIAGELAQQHPNDAKVAFLNGRILWVTGEEPRATAEFRRSLDLDPSDLAVWETFLIAYSAKEKADSLIYYADKAIKLFPNNAIIHFYKGIGLMNKEMYAEAVSIMTRVIDMVPDENTEQLARVYATLGDIYNQSKQFKLSDESYRKSLQLEPLNYGNMNNFAYYLSVRGENLDEAEKMSRQTVEKYPESSIYLDTYGWILYRQGKYSRAKDYIMKAIQLRPDGTDGTLYDHAGDVYYKLNDKQKALEFWKKAKDLGVENPLIDKKIQEQTLYE